MNISPPTRLSLPVLRARMGLLQPPAAHGVLPFGDPRVDGCLAGGGLALGALHEVAADGIEAETGALGAAFIACLLARIGAGRPVFWIFSSPDLYPPGLLEYGLNPGRLVLVQAAGDEQALAAGEAALRAGSAAAVVVEAGKLGRLASRRLQFACLKHGSTGFVLRRWPHGRRAAAQEVTASVTRWRLATAPSEAPEDAPAREPGRPRWRVELEHARGGLEGKWIMQAEWIMQAGGHHAPHPLRVVAELADPAPAPARSGHPPLLRRA